MGMKKIKKFFGCVVVRIGFYYYYYYQVGETYMYIYRARKGLCVCVCVVLEIGKKNDIFKFFFHSF
jgi:hypothetical protein